jgi:hypothetical protein
MEQLSFGFALTKTKKSKKAKTTSFSKKIGFTADINLVSEADKGFYKEPRSIGFTAKL